MSDYSTVSASPFNKSRGPRSPAPINEKRVSLACLRCRTKRARCSGDKPVCRACEKAKEECVWPSGRRRKRTRKEMEEEERRERLASSAADSMGYRARRTPVHQTGWASSNDDLFTRRSKLASDWAGACAPYITKAQEMIIVLVHLPTTDVVTGLLLLAWASYGQNGHPNGDGPWTIRDFSAPPQDRILAFKTGRPPTIPEEIIEIPLPTDEDFVAGSARADIEDEELPQPTPFVYMVRLMVLCGRITTVLAGCRGEMRTLLPHVGKDYPAKLKELQAELVQFYAQLSDVMKWSVDAFKNQEARGHGDSFLTLHLWANTVLAVSFHPELQERSEGNLSPITQNVERSMKASLRSSRIIAECLVFADLLASHSYTNAQLTSPFAVQPIYVASLAFIYDIKSTDFNASADSKSNQSVDNLLSTLARQNLAVLTKALQRMEHYWVGISSVSDILDQNAAGLGFQRIDASRKAHLPDLALSDRPPIFIST
ncbi:hypothetical protein C0989_005420 [Termitomyces sp. Mn162]|nr:hypothetical protein C0989_005420 [Termitomyces sp. Mn162]